MRGLVSPVDSAPTSSPSCSKGRSPLTIARPEGSGERRPGRVSRSLRRSKQRDRLRSEAFAPAGEPEAIGRGRADVHAAPCSTPSAPASRSRMASRWGAIRGSSPITTQSAFTSSKPCVADLPICLGEQLERVGAAVAVVVGGEQRPDVGEAGRAEQRIRQRVSDDVSVRVPDETRADGRRSRRRGRAGRRRRTRAHPHRDRPAGRSWPDPVELCARCAAPGPVRARSSDSGRSPRRARPRRRALGARSRPCTSRLPSGSSPRARSRAARAVDPRTPPSASRGRPTRASDGRRPQCGTRRTGSLSWTSLGGSAPGTRPRASSVRSTDVLADTPAHSARSSGGRSGSGRRGSRQGRTRPERRAVSGRRRPPTRTPRGRRRGRR